MKDILLTGSIPALVTPFAKDESIDLVAWKKWLCWHDQQSSRSVVVFGSTGEGVSLAEEERALLLKTARKNLCSTGMIVGVAAPSTEMAIDQARQAKDMGAQAILLTTPFYVKPDQNGLCQHYLKVSQMVGIPIILYTVPSRTGIDLDTQTIVSLSQDKNIVGIKDASGKRDRVAEIITQTNDNFIYLSGNDSEIIEHLQCGSDGAISVVANLLPSAMQSIMGNYKANPQWAKGKFAKIQPIIQAIEQHGNPRAIKHMVQILFNLSGTMRLPLTEVDTDAQNALAQCLQKAQISPQPISET